MSFMQYINSNISEYNQYMFCNKISLQYYTKSLAFRKIHIVGGNSHKT